MPHEPTTIGITELVSRSGLRGSLDILPPESDLELASRLRREEEAHSAKVRKEEADATAARRHLTGALVALLVFASGCLAAGLGAPDADVREFAQKIVLAVISGAVGFFLGNKTRTS